MLKLIYLGILILDNGQYYKLLLSGTYPGKEKSLFQGFGIERSLYKEMSSFQDSHSRFKLGGK